LDTLGDHGMIIDYQDAREGFGDLRGHFEGPWLYCFELGYLEARGG
jgi:hypothetical protein